MKKVNLTLYFLAMAFQFICTFLFIFFSPVDGTDLHIIILFSASIIIAIIGLILLFSIRRRELIIKTLFFTAAIYLFILGIFYIAVGSLASINNYKFTLFDFTIQGCRGYDFREADIMLESGILYGSTMPYLMILLCILFILGEALLYCRKPILHYIASAAFVSLGILILLTPVFASIGIDAEAVSEVERINTVVLYSNYHITVGGYLYSFVFIAVGIAYGVISKLLFHKDSLE